MKENTRTFGIKRIVCLALMLLLVLGVATSVAILSEVQADAVNVASEAALRTAVEAGGSITLTANVTLTSKDLEVKKATTINLNGHSISIWGKGRFVINKTLTIQGKGSIGYVSEATAFQVDQGSLVISGSSYGAIDLHYGGTDPKGDCTNFINCAGKRTASAPGSVTIKNVIAKNFHDTINGDGGFLDVGSSVAGSGQYWNINISSSKFSGCFANKGGAIMVSNDAIGVNMSINSCTFDNCNTENGDGGAIDFLSASSSVASYLTINQCYFTNNTAKGNGGAINILLGKGTFTLTGCSISGNTGNYGGAIRAAAPSNIINNNIFSENTGNYGGAVEVATDKDAQFTGNTFSKNVAHYDGGAIYTVGQTTVHTGNFWDNTAWSYGGMISVEGNGVLNLMTASCSSNAAGYGGCVAMVNTTTDRASVIQAGTYWKSGATQKGGAVYLGNARAVLNVTGGNFTTNRASAEGGAFAVTAGKLTLGTPTSGPTVIQNTTNKAGGGIYATGSSTFVTINRAAIGQENGGNTAASSGGGIYISGGATVTLQIEGSWVLDNTASVYGGGICNNGGNLTIKNGVVQNNIAHGNGGGIFTSGPTTIDNLGIYGNKAWSYGGGISVEDNGVLTINNIGFSGNSATNGGCLAMVNTTTSTASTIKAGTFWQATATDKGGAVYLGNAKAVLNVTGGKFTGCTATNEGGGFAVTAGTLYLGNATAGPTVTNNTAGKAGGGVYVTGGSSSVVLDYVAIGQKDLGNTAKTNGGGIYSSNNAMITLKNANAKVQYNTATGAGGGIYSGGKGLSMSNGNISYNHSGNNSGGVSVASGTFGMSGGTIGNNTSASAAGVANFATFNMTGGSITANKSSTHAGGIYNTGTFNMSGGSITNNYAPNHSGGVYNGKQMNMSGGSITGNTTNGAGGGVYENGGAYFYGSTIIKDNKSGSANNNVYLPAGGTFTLGTLNGDARIGVTAASMSKTSGPVQIITAGSGANTGSYSGKKKIDLSPLVSVLDNGAWLLYSDNSDFYTGIGTKDDTTNGTVASLYSPGGLYYWSHAAGVTVTPASKSVIYGMPVGALPVLTRPGYTFDGWFTELEGGTQYTSSTVYNVVGATNLFAHWTAIPYTITYYETVNGAAATALSNLTPVSYTVANAVTLPAAPAKAGYSVISWYDNAACNGTPLSTIPVGSTGNKTLYAKYTTLPDDTYAITYILNGGTHNPANPAIYHTGTAVTLQDPLAAPDGMTFDHWINAKGETVTGIPTTATGDQQFTAIYKHNSYQIKYYQVIDGTETLITPALTPATYTHGTAVTLPALPALDGKVADGWHLSKDGLDARITAISNTQSGDVNVYVLYTDTPKPEHTITYVLDGGANHADNPAKYTEGTTVLLMAPSKAGYDFAGWYEEATFTTPTSGVVATDTTDKTFYAKFTVADREYSVTFENGGATGTVPDALAKRPGESFQIPAAELTKPGFTHVGWTLKGGDGTICVPDQEYIMPAKDIVFVPVFAKTPIKVTFDPNGGECQTEFINLEWGDEYGKDGALPTATKTGYTFNGWFTTMTGGEQITDTSKVTQINDHTLYAHWTAKVITVVFDKQGGTGTMTDQNFVYNDSQALRENTFTAPTGKVFAGWSKTENTTSTNFSDKQIIKASDLSECNEDSETTVTLYAVWKNPDPNPLIKEPYENGIRVKLDVINAFSSMHLGYDTVRNEYAVHANSFDLSALLVDGTGTLNWVVTDERGLGTTSYLTVDENTVTISHSGYYKCVGTATDNRTCTIYIYAPGDVNADSQVTGYDAAKISRHNGGFESITDDIALLMADTNNDWIISSYDWNNIINYNNLGHPLSVPQNAQAERTAIYAVLSDSKFSI